MMLPEQHEELALLLIRPHILQMAVPHNFKCPNLECRAEYYASRLDYAPHAKPKCSKCNTPFLAMKNGRYLHYQAAWDVVPMNPGINDPPKTP